MNKITLTICSILMLVSCYCTSQNELNIREIKFSYKHSMMIPNNSVDITLNNYARNGDIRVSISSQPMYDAEEWAHTKSDTVFTIPKADFKKIKEEIAKINLDDVYANFNIMGVDGYTTKLTYGNSFNSVSFKVFGPTYNTKKRKLQNFLDVCELLLNTVCIEPKSILFN